MLKGELLRAVLAHGGLHRNARAGPPPGPSERSALCEALLWAQRDSTPEEALLAVAVVLWGGAYRELRSAPLDEVAELAVEMAPKVALDLDERRVREIALRLAPIDGHLPTRVGHFFDELVFQLYRSGRWKSPQANPRKRNGVYLTPYSLARLMVERALDALDGNPPLPVLDPGTGTGVFLSATLHALGERGFSPREVLKGLLGVEKERAFSWMAKLLLSLEAGLEAEEVISGKGPSVLVEDFLLGNLKGLSRFALVLANPPYERLAKVDGADEEAKAEARAYAERIRSSGLYPLSSRGSMESYRLFLERALGFLAPGGAASFVVPATLLTDKSARLLRERFTSEKREVSIDLYPERPPLFKGVSQEVVVLTLGPSGRKEEAKLRALYRGHPIGSAPIEEVRSLFKDRALPLLNSRGWALYRHLANAGRLGDLPGVIIRRGELDQDFDREFLGKGEGRFLRGRHLKRFCVVGEERCDLEGFLERRGGRRTEHVRLPRLAGRQVSNRRARERLVFAFVEPPTLLGNSLNYLLIEARHASPFDLWTLLGLLNTNLIDWFFRVTNSNNHVGLYELEALPLPFEAAPSALAQIGFLAAQVSEGHLSQERRAEIVKEINGLALEAYGIHPEDLREVFPPFGGR